MIRAFAALGKDQIVTNWDYTPRPLQPEDIEIKIIASGICHSDIHQLLNEWRESPRPLVPGHEIVGIVIRKGEKSLYNLGQRVAVGTLVGCCFNCVSCKRGEENYCRYAVDTYTGVHQATKIRTMGGFAEGMVVDSRFAFAVPDSLPSTTAAPLLCAGATVYSPLKRYCKPTDAVGVVGIGGLGHLALQFARALKIQSITAITGSKDKTESALKLGATDFIHTGDKNQMKERSGTFDFLLVTVSADLPWQDYLRLLKVGGHLCMVGLPPSGDMKLNAFQLTAKRIMVSGSNTASLTEIRDLLNLAGESGIRCQVELLPLTANGANEGVKRVMNNTPRFRCVLVREDVKL